MEKPNLFSRPTIQYAAAALLPLLVVVGAVQYFGSVHKMIAVLDGQVLVLKSATIVEENLDQASKFGDIAKFTMQNVSGSEVRVVGCRAACSCITMTDLPVKVAPNSECELIFRVTGTREKEVGESITLFTVPPGTPVWLRIETEPTQFTTEQPKST